MRLIRLTWLAVLVVVLASGRLSSALDSGHSVTQLGLDHWSTREGLPQDKVQALAQTPDGFLWIGTQNGLARFDGVHFTLLTSPELPILEHTSVHGLAVDSDGSLWIGTDLDGLVHWQNGHARHVHIREVIRFLENEFTFMNIVKINGLRKPVGDPHGLIHKDHRGRV